MELVSNSIDVNEVQKLWGSKAHWKILDSIDVAVECPRCTYQPHNEIDERSAETVKSLYLSMCDNRPRAVAMSLINAEIAKLSLNCFVTMKISFANELASICEKIPGADIDAVTDALGADTRIGPKYLKAGLGFGGTCFPRDNLAFQAFAGDSGMNARLGTAVVQINHSVVDRLFNMIYRKAESGGKIALLGLSYKPGTYITEESQSLMLARKLTQAGYNVAVHDPKALQSAKTVLRDTVFYFEDPYTCVKDAVVIVLLTNWQLYRESDWTNIGKSAKAGALLLDSWRILKNIRINNLRVVGLGLGEK